MHYHAHLAHKIKVAGLGHVERYGRWESPREGERVALFSIEHHQQPKGYEYTARRDMRLIERTIDNQGLRLLSFGHKIVID